MRHEKSNFQKTRELLNELDDIIRETVYVSDGWIVYGDIQFDAAAMLRRVDPIVYRELILDYADDNGVDIDDIDWDFVQERTKW